MIPFQPGLYRPDLHYQGEWTGIHYVAFTKTPLVHSCSLGFDSCRCFETGGSLGRRVRCRRVPQPRWVGARPSAKGGSEAAGDGRERGGNPAAFVFIPRPGASALSTCRRGSRRGFGTRFVWCRGRRRSAGARWKDNCRGCRVLADVLLLL
jgi:hypothetical protein